MFVAHAYIQARINISDRGKQQGLAGGAADAFGTRLTEADTGKISGKARALPVSFCHKDSTCNISKVTWMAGDSRSSSPSMSRDCQQSPITEYLPEPLVTISLERRTRHHIRTLHIDVHDSDSRTTSLTTVAIGKQTFLDPPFSSSSLHNMMVKGPGPKTLPKNGGPQETIAEPLNGLISLDIRRYLRQLHPLFTAVRLYMLC
ncbi:hypothetical protein D9757_006427 [Collybiopsis confluens]|uniref:Uncharacterized protein n=1 Tax=Collybiopsis confluens TaxID=2823264 RepID=A0A8H5M7Y0_9AGAR|nr:hypothetical protein D9757_006427 [Collybiopsis confluens]